MENKFFDLIGKILPPIPFLIGISLFTALLGYLPENVLQLAKLDTLPSDWLQIIRLVFLASLIILALSFFLKTKRRILKFSSGKLPKVEELVDKEQAIMFLLHSVPGKKAGLLTDNFRIKRLEDLDLIEWTFHGFVVASDHQDYRLTKKGIKFMKKHSNTLGKKFNPPSKMFEFINEVTEKEYTWKEPAKFKS